MAKKIKEKRTEFCNTCKYIKDLYNTNPEGEFFMGVCELDGFSKLLFHDYCENYTKIK